MPVFSFQYAILLCVFRKFVLWTNLSPNQNLIFCLRAAAALLGMLRCYYPIHVLFVIIIATAAFASAADVVVAALSPGVYTSNPIPPDQASFSIEVSNVKRLFLDSSGAPRRSWANFLNNLRSAANGGDAGVSPYLVKFLFIHSMLYA